jgi:hypothetical protein
MIEFLFGIIIGGIIGSVAMGIYCVSVVEKYTGGKGLKSLEGII